MEEKAQKSLRISSIFRDCHFIFHEHVTSHWDRAYARRSKQIEYGACEADSSETGRETEREGDGETDERQMRE